MTKLEEILDIFPTQNFDRERVKEIATAYAKLCLEKAAEEATLSFSGIDNEIETDLTGCSNDYGSYWINKQSITNIKLP